MLDKYLSNFECLKADCPQSCCQHLSIGIDEDDRHRLLTHYSAEQLDSMSQRSQFGALILKQSDIGFCVLNNKGLCELKLDAADFCVPKVCQGFPFVKWQLPGYQSIVGSLACPAIVEQCLFDEQAFASRDVAVPEYCLPGKFTEGSAVYQKYFPRVQAGLLTVIANRNHSLYQSTHSIILLCYELSKFYTARVSHLDEFRLEKVMAQFSREDQLEYPQYSLDHSAIADLFHIIFHWIDHSDNNEDRVLVKESLMINNIDPQDNSSITLFMQQLEQILQDNHDIRSLLHLSMRNLLINCIKSNPFVRSGNPFANQYFIILQVLLIMILIFLQLNSRQQNHNNNRESLFDDVRQLIKSVTHRFYRNFMMKKGFLEQLQEALADSGCINLSYIYRQLVLFHPLN